MIRTYRHAAFTSDNWEAPRTRAGRPHVTIHQDGDAIGLLLHAFDGTCSLADTKEKAGLLARALVVAELWKAQTEGET